MVVSGGQTGQDLVLSEGSEVERGLRLADLQLVPRSDECLDDLSGMHAVDADPGKVCGGNG